MDLKVRLTESSLRTIAQIKARGKKLPAILGRGIYRSLEYLRGQVDLHLRKGTFGIKQRTGGAGLIGSLETDVKIAGSIVVGNLEAGKIYAAIQEKGGKIKVTPKMAGFAWHMWYETGQIMWKAIALKKGRHITIPAHWYMRQTLKLNKSAILNVINKNLLAGLSG